MKVIGHHVVKIDVRIDPLKVEIGKFLVSTCRSNRDLILLAHDKLQSIELVAQQCQCRLKVVTIVGADGVSSLAATAGVFPVEVNNGKEVVSLQGLNDAVGERLTISGRIHRQTEFIGKCPAA